MCHVLPGKDNTSWRDSQGPLDQAPELLRCCAMRLMQMPQLLMEAVELLQVALGAPLSRCLGDGGRTAARQRATAVGRRATHSCHLADGREQPGAACKWPKKRLKTAENGSKWP